MQFIWGVIKSPCGLW